MEGLSVSRASLESLTTSDLIKMADNLGVDIPPELDRIFIIEELLEITSQDDDGASASREPDLFDTVLAETAALPKQYNITYIEVMVRDPLWAFVFWEIKAQDKEQIERTQDFDGYFLKVSLLDDSGAPAPKGNAGVFTVAVKPDDSAWYLGLTPGSGDGPEAAEQVSSPPAKAQDQSSYKVELCAALKGSEMVLAVAKPVRLPGLHYIPSGAANQEASGAPACCAGEHPLVRLSGYADFHILRKNERNFRGKRGNGCSNE